MKTSTGKIEKISLASKTSTDKSENTPLARFFLEAVRLLLTQKYLLTIHLSPLDSTHAIHQAHDELTKNVAPTYKSPYTYILARLFISHIAAFELFLQETVTEVIAKHPKKVGDTSFKLSDFLDANSTSELIERATEAALNKLMYKKPLEYLEGICHILSIEKEPLEERWKTFVEAKARRDLGVHNAWKCNTTYLRKIEEVNLPIAVSLGTLLLPVEASYISAVVDTLNTLAQDISIAVRAKHSS